VARRVTMPIEIIFFVRLQFCGFIGSSSPSQPTSLSPGPLEYSCRSEFISFLKEVSSEEFGSESVVRGIVSSNRGRLEPYDLMGADLTPPS
jgi:hypothetical protein